MNEKRKTFSIQAVKTSKGRPYHQEIGKLDEVEQEDGRVFKYLNLYMFPDTKFKIKEDVVEKIRTCTEHELEDCLECFYSDKEVSQ